MSEVQDDGISKEQQTQDKQQTLIMRDVFLLMRNDLFFGNVVIIVHEVGTMS